MTRLTLPRLRPLWAHALLLGLAVAACRPLPEPGTPAAAAPARSAVISELHRSVEARASEAATWQAAVEGVCIGAGGGARTGDDARARVDTAEGDIIRLGGRTEFVLEAYAPAETTTRLRLGGGVLWISVQRALGRALFEVETPAGVSSVRGTFLGVALDGATGRMTVTCLEGACALTASTGRTAALAAGQAAEIPAPGADPSAPRPMTAVEYADWAANFPGAPTPTATPPPTASAPPPTATPPPPPSVLLSPGDNQCSAQTVPAGPVELTMGVGRWKTAEEASAAVGESTPTITLNGAPVAVAERRGPEWHTGGEPPGWGFTARVEVRPDPGTYTITSQWYWSDIFTCLLTVE